MKTINLALLTDSIHFPVMKAIPDYQQLSFFNSCIRFFTYRRKFKVMKDYILWVPFLDQFIFVPAYFIFDGASVPKLLNGFFSPTGILLLGALPHDFGYRYQGLFHVNLTDGSLFFVPYTKDQLDKIFGGICSYGSGMKIAPKVARKLLGVFGFFGWKENRKLNRNLFKDFPELYVKEDCNV